MAAIETRPDIVKAGNAEPIVRNGGVSTESVNASQRADPLIRQVPANPVRRPACPVVGKRKLGLLHQVVIGLTQISSGAAGITHRHVDAGRIGRRGAGSDRKGKDFVCGERVGVSARVVRIHIVDRVLKDRDGALLSGDEVDVRRDCLGVAAKERPDGRTVVVSLETQLMSYHPLSTVTGSVKLMTMVASRGADVAPLRGSVAKTAGPISTIGAVRRGFGAPITKSAELLSVSVLPPFLRKAAVVLLGAAALCLRRSWPLFRNRGNQRS